MQTYQIAAKFWNGNPAAANFRLGHESIEGTAEFVANFELNHRKLTDDEKTEIRGWQTSQIGKVLMPHLAGIGMGGLMKGKYIKVLVYSLLNGEKPVGSIDVHIGLREDGNIGISHDVIESISNLCFAAQKAHLGI